MPVMLADELKAVQMAEDMNERGIFVVGFSFPVVLRGEARIGVQVSATHSQEHLETVLTEFETVGKKLGVI